MEVMNYLNPEIEDFNIKKYQETYDGKYTEEDEEQEKFRNLSSEITYNNVKRIIIIVLFLIGIIPMFEMDSYTALYEGQVSDLHKKVWNFLGQV